MPTNTPGERGISEIQKKHLQKLGIDETTHPDNLTEEEIKRMTRSDYPKMTKTMGDFQ